jgi:hypothetical protein
MKSKFYERQQQRRTRRRLTTCQPSLGFTVGFKEGGGDKAGL